MKISNLMNIDVNLRSNQHLPLAGFVDVGAAVVVVVVVVVVVMVGSKAASTQ